MGWKRTPINRNLTIKKIKKKYNVNRQLAHHYKNNGWIAKRTKAIPDIMINLHTDFPVETAYKAARKAFFEDIYSRIQYPLDHIDDCVQEAIIKMMELSGRTVTNQFSYFCRIGKFEMYNYLQRIRVLVAGRSLRIKFVSYEMNMETIDNIIAG